MSRILLLISLLAALGCNAKPVPKNDAPTAATAVAGAMCPEHGVLEAVCTKCNASLIPVFQAKGDWCAEHGLPESFCPICSPERGGKPVVDVATEEAPADGLRIRFKTKETAQVAGIETAKALERPSAGFVVAPVRLSYDATKQAHINARSPGIVRELRVDVGSVVKKGAPLVVIDSPNVGADRARLTAAKTRVQAAQENFEREKQLHTEGITSRQSFLAAQQVYEGTISEHAALAAALSVMSGAGGTAGSYTLVAPLTGVVTERHASIGKLVDTEDILFEIVDTSSMWADVDVAEADLRSVAVGQSVSLEFASLEGRDISGTIAYVSPAVDAHTQSAKARVPLANPDGSLRANLYGRAKIVTGGSKLAVVVPRSAIQRAQDVQLAFVRIAADEYETRRVQLGSAEGDRIEILKGLRAGEEVVTTGSFLLKTETLKDSIGAGCCAAE